MALFQGGGEGVCISFTRKGRKEVLSIFFQSVGIRIQKLPKKHLSPDVTLYSWLQIFSVLLICYRYLYLLCLYHPSYRVRRLSRNVLHTLHVRNSRVANDVGELHASNAGRTDNHLPFRTDDSDGNVSGYTETEYQCISVLNQIFELYDYKK